MIRRRTSALGGAVLLLGLGVSGSAWAETPEEALAASASSLNVPAGPR